MPMVESSKESIRLYSMIANIFLARRYMRQLESIGAPHPERRTIDNAINLIAPAYRDRLEHDIENTELFRACNVGPNGVEHAIRLARALREIYGIADEPRKTTAI